MKLLLLLFVFLDIFLHAGIVPIEGRAIHLPLHLAPVGVLKIQRYLELTDRPFGIEGGTIESCQPFRFIADNRGHGTAAAGMLAYRGILALQHPFKFLALQLELLDQIRHGAYSVRRVTLMAFQIFLSTGIDGGAVLLNGKGLDC